MKYILDFIGYRASYGDEYAEVLIRSSGTTGNLTEDFKSAFSCSAVIKNGKITEFTELGPNRLFNVGRRAGFKVEVLTRGYDYVDEEFLENKWPGISTTLTTSAAECIVFQLIKYNGNRET